MKGYRIIVPVLLLLFPFFAKSQTIGTTASYGCAGTSQTVFYIQGITGCTPQPSSLNSWSVSPSTGVTITPVTTGNYGAVFVTFSSHGFYTVSVTYSCGNGYSSFPIEVYPPAVTTLSITSTGVNFCEMPNKFNATATNVGSNPVYEWRINGSVISGYTSTGGTAFTPPSSLFKAGDVVSATVFSQKPCGTGTAVSNSITVTKETATTIPSDQSLQFCDFEHVKLSIPLGDNQTSFKWYSHAGNFLGEGRTLLEGLKGEGTYQYEAEVIDAFGCTSADRISINVTVSSDCDSKLNWIENISYDENEQIVSHSKSYFSTSGNLLQDQSKNLTEQQVLTSQSIEDEYDRKVAGSLSAPLNKSEFQYKHKFATNQSGAQYNHENLNQPFDNSEPGTVGWYYSSNNTIEKNVPVTDYPFSQVEFYNDGSGDVRKSGGPGELHRLGMDHEILSGVFPVFNELDDYVEMRNQVLGITGISSLIDQGIQNVARDQNRNYSVVIRDKDGKGVMSALPATLEDHVLKVDNKVVSSGSPLSDNYRPLTYFYILSEQAVTITGSSDFVVEDILNDVTKPEGQTFGVGANGNWPVGFYRVILKNTTSEVEIKYTNYFRDVAYQFYDDMGRVVSSISPNGVSRLVTESYGDIDKTTYKYNFRGWLQEISEPDAGITKFLYRKDGQIRFTQNAQQAIDRTFSYTSYDKVGRPIESGQYKLNVNEEFSDLNTPARLQAIGNDWMNWTAERKGWMRSEYDYPKGYPDNSFIEGTKLPQLQEFVRGSVSQTENANILTWYSYDELGRLKWMTQKPKALKRYFVVKYVYDFLGNVRMTSSLAFDEFGNLLSEFYHHYTYDRDMRLDKAYTSLTETGEKKLRAKYEYYLHGPLKRIELGDQLQGVDFVYNINGWLTQINHPNTDNPESDPGRDGVSGSSFNKDVFGLLLNYYESEFTNLFEISSLNPAKENLTNPFANDLIPSSVAALIKPAMMSKNGGGQPMAYSPKDYSAAKPLFRELLKQYMADNEISLRGYQADEVGNHDFSPILNQTGALASTENTYAGVTGSEKRFLIDFGDPTTPTNLPGWNNMTSGLTGSLSPYLVDTDNIVSTIRVEIVKNASNGFGNGNYYNPDGYNGVVEDYPASACRDSYFSYGTGGTYKLKGLDPSKYYTLKIFGSRTSTTIPNRVGSYTINGTQKTLSAANNNSTFTYFYNLRPSTAGEIVLDFGVATGSQLGYINVMDIVQKDEPGIVGPGSSLTSQVVSRKGVLSWTDNSSNETGYRIERRKSGETVFQVLTDVASNVNTYTDMTVAVGFTYEYRINAFNSSEESPYSNSTTLQVAGVADTRFLVDFGNPAFPTTGWNNMPSGLTGSVLNDLKNILGNTSTIDIEVVQDASATYKGDGIYYNTIGYNGQVGDYPARACLDSYFSFGSGGVYKLKGLDINKLYSITIFGSRTGVTKDDRRGTFTINGIRKVLDAANNSSRTVTFYHLIPDSNGEIKIEFGVDTNSFLGYMNVWDILEVSNPIVESPVALLAQNIVNGVSLTWGDVATNETGYRIERKLTIETTYKQIAEVGAGTTQYIDNSTLTGTEYQYRIAAAYGSVNSAYSNTITHTTAGSPPDRRYLIDFGSAAFTTNLPGWNNFTSNVAGYTLQNLVDANGNGSPLGVQMVTVASNGFGNGDVFNTNGYDGIALGYPASACKDSYFSYLSGGGFMLKNLNVNRYYSITIFGSRVASDARKGTYTVNGKQYILEAANNSTQTITLYNIKPTETGEIQLSFGVASGSSLGYLGVMDIAETASPVVANPKDLSVLVDGRFANLSWSDNSTNEAGFKIERRAGTEQIFTVVGTVGAGVTQYSDGLLGSGITYEYRVAAYLAPEVLSAYTNSVSINTPGVPARRFLIDFGDPVYPTTVSGWNNMTGAATGTVLDNMIDSKLGASSYSFEITKNASNGYGDGTPYNSLGYVNVVGDYPITACRDSYFAYAAGGIYKLKNLNPSYYYTINIFGSRQASDANRIGSYIINGEKKTLNAANNSSTIISFKQIQPNKLGEIILEFGVEAGSQLGYINVVDFTEYSVPDLNPPVLLTTQKLAGTAGVKLTWSDNTIYESGYEIYRATGSVSALFTLLTTTATNATTYTDATASSSSVYFYRIRATSSKGVSPYSNTLISDNAIDPPVLHAIENQVVNAGGKKDILLQATPGGNVAPDRKNIVILGSSTAAGTGANPIGNSWAALFTGFLSTNYNTGWNVVNLAVSGYTSNNVIVTGDPEHNITKALSYNPVLIIINLPSNDVAAGIPNATFMANLTAIKQQAETAGVKVLITTTQPRNLSTLSQRTILQTLANDIKTAFGSSVVDVYSSLADANLNINTTYSAGDGVHVNNAGHAIIYQAVKMKAEFLLNKTQLEFTVTNAPSFVRITQLGNGQGRIEIEPTALHLGTYSNIIVSAVDRNGNFGNQTLEISVDKIDDVPASNYKVKPMYNGLITSAAWRTTSPGSSGMSLSLASTENLKGMFLYEYDDKYQFLNANWAEPLFGTPKSTFIMQGQRYRVTGMEYNPNGNIIKLNRYDANGARKNTFNYAYAANKNQLLDVTGYTTPGGTTNHGFAYNAIGQMVEEYKADGTNQLVDYDVNGKVIAVYSNSKVPANLKVEYLYDDRGNRLAKVSYPLAGSPDEPRTTWYIRDISGNVLNIYEQEGKPDLANEHPFVETEVPIYGAGKLGVYYPQQGGSTAYEITDHLGNVRAVVRDNSNQYVATMEDSNLEETSNPAVQEEYFFRNIEKTRVTDSHMNHTSTTATAVDDPDKAAYLFWQGGVTGMDAVDRSVGPAIGLKTIAGDKVSIETWARFLRQEDYTQDISLLVFSQFMGGTFGNVLGFDGMAQAETVSTLENALGGIFSGTGIDESQPRAFLNYIIFDQNMVSVASDRIQVSDAAGFEPGEEMLYQPGTGLPIDPDIGFEHLLFPNPIEIPVDGYIYIWVSNLSENTKVWFDDLTVAHTQKIVTQATDYGVWGDVIREQKADESKYRFGYQGKFSEKDEETGWNHFELREYDPIIGRWLAPDPYNESWSPYVSMLNNPVSSVDPDGGCVSCAIYAALQFLTDPVTQAAMQGSTVLPTTGIIAYPMTEDEMWDFDHAEETWVQAFERYNAVGRWLEGNFPFDAVAGIAFFSSDGGGPVIKTRDGKVVGYMNDPGALAVFGKKGGPRIIRGGSIPKTNVATTATEVVEKVNEIHEGIEHAEKTIGTPSIGEIHNAVDSVWYMIASPTNSDSTIITVKPNNGDPEVVRKVKGRVLEIHP